MFQRILVPLDESPLAEQTLPVAARIARASGGSILLLQIVSAPVDLGGGLAPVPLMTDQVIESRLAEGTNYLDQVAKSPVLAGIKTTTEIMFGIPAQDILDVAETKQVDLIVICSHGRTGLTRLALGSIAHRIVHRSSMPVLVLREGESAPLVSHADTALPLCALVALDGSSLAETALAPAANLVAALAAPAAGALHLFQVVKKPSANVGESSIERIEAYLSTVKDRLQETFKDLKLSITWSVAADSDVAHAIISTAEHGQQREGTGGLHNCGLVALSTHGRGELERMMMGSVAEHVLNTTKLPVLVVHPQRNETNKG
jgi:nucleotide-binding universal stress UspA family protein